MSKATSVPDVSELGGAFAEGLPKLWGFAPYDVEALPYLITVELPFGASAERLSELMLLLHTPGVWEVVGFHAQGEAGADHTVTHRPPVCLVASRRPNPRIFHAIFLERFLAAGGSASLGAPLSRSNFLLARETPGEIAEALSKADISSEALHMAVHVAAEEGLPPYLQGRSHLMCPATPLELLMDVFRTSDDRMLWEIFINYRGDARPIEVETAARLATQERMRKPDALEPLALALTDED